MSAYSDAVLADSPNGYWRFHNLLDTANLAGSLTVGSNQTAAAGLLEFDQDAAVSLNGSTDYYTAADGTYTDLTDTFTLEGWILPTDVSAQRRLFDKGTNAYSLLINTGGAIQAQKSGASVIVTSTATCGIVTPSHVAWTKDGATNALYINGVDVTGTVTNATCANTSTALHIGRTAASADRYFYGIMDEFAIYPTALAAARILAHYQAGAGVLAAASADGLTLTPATADSLSLGAA